MGSKNELEVGAGCCMSVETGHPISICSNRWRLSASALAGFLPSSPHIAFGRRMVTLHNCAKL